VNREYHPIRSVKPLTIPKEFNFTKRIEHKVNVVPEPEPLPPKKVPGELTIPKPFKLRTSQRVHSIHMDHSPIKPLAEQIKEVENETPERFKKTVEKVVFKRCLLAETFI
jgi:hypothetical protein